MILQTLTVKPLSPQQQIMPSVSIIIPTWNRAQWVCRAVRSAIEQTCQALEIIVVDDGSSDATVSILRSTFPDIRVVEQTNKGVSSARNTGIRLAQGDWIALLDSDDEWLPEKLERQLAALQTDNLARLVHCDEIWIRNGVRVNARKKHQKQGGWIYPNCLPLCAISPSAALIRRDVFDDVGFFDESLPACEDYDYWLRYCAHEPVIYVNDRLLRKFGGHEDQLSAKYWGMDRFRMQALAKAIRSGQLNPQYLALTQSCLAEKSAIFLQGARKRNNHCAANQIESLYHDLLPGNSTGDDPYN